MRPISSKVKAELLANPRMSRCARLDEGSCDGRITWEHAIIHAGRQLDESWAILGICEYHHGVNKYQDGGAMNKEKHEWLALRQAPEGRLKELSKAINYEQKLKYLNTKYGTGSGDTEYDSSVLEIS